MRIYLYSILLLSILSGQFGSNFTNGFGSNNRIILPFSESMGGMWMYNSNTDNWDPLLASSLYKSNLTAISVSSSFEGIQTDSYEVNEHLINSVNFSFPVGSKTAIAIGLSPYTRTGYFIDEKEYSFIGGTEYSAPLASKSSYNIQGGISEFSIALSRALFNEKVDFGFKWNILFGNQELNTTTSLAELSYSHSADNIFTLKEIIYGYEFSHFNGHLYEIDSKININDNNSFSFLVSLIDDFEVSQNEMSHFFSIDKNYLFDKLQVDEFALGYMYNRNDYFGVAFETHIKNSSNYPDEVMILNSQYPSHMSFHNGLYKIISNSRPESWNTLNLSAGYSYKIIKFNDQDLYDISASLGFGISFNDFKNNVNMSFTLGSRQSIVESIEKENYYKFNIAIISGEKWFEKRRRK